MKAATTIKRRFTKEKLHRFIFGTREKQGFGKQLMNLAKETARKEGNRVLMLETQSCNVNAIGFYLHEGFTLIGFDACCYSNQDLERKEVRLELGWFPDRADH